VKAGVRAVSSNFVAGQAKPETVSTTPVKAWVSIKEYRTQDSEIRIIRDLPDGGTVFY
jgi:hypothetical protein